MFKNAGRIARVVETRGLFLLRDISAGEEEQVLDAKDNFSARQAILFASLPSDVSDEILSRSVAKTFRRNTSLFLQGDTAESIYVVLDGWVKLFRITPTGAEAVVGVFTRGRSFGEAVAFDGSVYPVSAEVVTDSRILIVSARVLMGMMRERPEIAVAIMSSAFRHLQGLVAQIEQLKAHTGAQRVAEFLLELCNSDTGSCTITLPYDKTLIAGRLGMQPQSLSRAFNRLEGQGVKISHNQAMITDIDKLREYMMDDRSAPWRKAE